MSQHPGDVDAERRLLAGRWLIVNADDFGASKGINAGIARAHDTGIVSSTSLMVTMPAASDASSGASVYSTSGPGGCWACRVTALIPPALTPAMILLAAPTTWGVER
ncbi:MAG: Cellobiose phosphotransferase system YdjC-like protein [uncultured Nocardioidaceae bacterium]|uniref:Cellobiose phosphotransferase system YdjC-like protein n=1 Tax=uncultured Nocardioidaceae bacterium TaxID=253824 RepID=A0A6J4MH76_9ACTN|nr:MAG: Cellobiose phosphotransferase system YdjC-like protein [uncultured Nocardioidaceae bacterium]